MVQPFKNWTNLSRFKMPFKNWTRFQMAFEILTIFGSFLSGCRTILSVFRHHSKTRPFQKQTHIDHLNTGLVWYWNSQNVSASRMVWFLNGLWKPDKMVLKLDKNDLKSGPDFKWHLKTRQICPVFEWLNHLKSRQIFVWYSDESGIQVFGIQMVTVFKFRSLEKTASAWHLFEVQKKLQQRPLWEPRNLLNDNSLHDKKYVICYLTTPLSLSLTGSFPN